MNNSALRPTTILDNDWYAVRHTSASKVALERLAESEPLVAKLPARDLGDLVDLLRPRPRTADAKGSNGPDTASDGPAGEGVSVSVDAELPAAELPAAVVRAMLRSADVHPLVARAVVQALVPGLLAVARRLNWGTGGEWPDGDAFLLDAFATTWEIVTEWAGDDRRYAVLDLLSAVRCRLRRRLLQHRRHLDHVLTKPLEDTDFPSAQSCSAVTNLDQLAAAIDNARGLELERSDAAVLYAHRVLGYSLSELATLTGKSRRSLGVRRDHAAQVLTA